MRHKKNIIIVVMCISILIMGLGYALLSTQIDISGSTAVTSSWKIEFSDIRTRELHGGATNAVAPIAEGTSASFEVDLVLPGDYILYEIDITNYGDIDAEVKGATYNVSGSDAIFVYVDGIKKGTKLPSCEGLDTCPTITLTLKVGYDEMIKIDPTEKRKDIEFNIEVGQYIEENPTPESDLIPELKQPVLVDKILSDNTAYADNIASPYVTSTTGIKFGVGSGNVTIYDEVHGSSTQNLTFNASYKYYFGTSYNFNVSTGKYTLYGAIKNDTWSNMSDNYSTYLYTCMQTYSGGSCSTLYKINSYVSETSATAYSYTSKSGTANNGKGLYYTSTNTENNGTTYYFRGDVENNYVKFGTATNGKCTYNGQDVVIWDYDVMFIIPEETCKTSTVCLIGDKPILNPHYSSCDELSEYASSSGYFESDAEVIDTGEYAKYNEVVEDLIWRIIRINEDGSIRLISKDLINHSEYNSYPADSDNAGVGYMYGATGATGDNAYNLTHSNDNSSAIKGYIDRWYENNLISYSSYLADAGFCNDRSIAPSAGIWNSYDTALGYETNDTYYGPYNRLANLNKPQFSCPNESRDLFTTKGSTKGNKALEYPIGLITADEFIYAGGLIPYSSSNSSNIYLKNNDTYHSMSWTMSPWYANGSANQLYFTGNALSEYGVYFPIIGTRPVINLKSNVEITNEIPDGCTKQDGTASCPYIIKTN